MRIEIKNLGFSFNKHNSESDVLSNINFSADSGELIALLGPNGAGKTTLFRCLLGFLQPQRGEILLEGHSISNLSPKEMAGYIAYIPQSYSPAFNLDVLTSVLLGSSRKLGTFGVPSKDDEKNAMSILESLGIANLSRRGIMKISGGERQLVLVARALVQDAKILIMDEPTANLDYGNSFSVMNKISELRNMGYTIIFSTHDPQQALRYSDRVIALKNGRVCAEGKAEKVLTSETLSELYSIDVIVDSISRNNKEYKVCTPL